MTFKTSLRRLRVKKKKKKKKKKKIEKAIEYIHETTEEEAEICIEVMQQMLMIRKNYVVKNWTEGIPFLLIKRPPPPPQVANKLNLGYINGTMA